MNILQSTVAHYGAFHTFLNGNVNRQANLDKLSRLSPQQFFELSKDVYDEFQRRNTMTEQFLPPNPMFHEKRNLARQKLARLPQNPFTKLVGDVYLETERRYPEIIANMDNWAPSGPELPPRSEQQYRVDQQPRLEQQHRNESVTQLATGLQHSNDASTRQAENRQIQELNITIDAITRAKDKLQSDYDSLKDNFIAQENAANQIRLEAAQLVKDTSSLAQNNRRLEDLLANEKNERALLTQNNIKLEDLLAQEKKGNAALKDKVEELERQLAALKTSRMGSLSRNSTSQSSLGRTSQINMGDNLQAFKSAIQNLESSLVAEQATSILVAMKSVVLCCKKIIESVEDIERAIPVDSKKQAQLDSYKERLSDYLTNLMALSKENATKDLATRRQITMQAPLNELDSVVAKIVSLVGELESAPSGEPMKPEELKVPNLTQEFLELQTSQVVNAIQRLLDLMRRNDTFDMGGVVSEITLIVGQVVDFGYESFITYSADPSAAIDAIEKLSDASIKLEKHSMMEPTPAMRKGLASFSYEIAKHIKELISLLE